MVMLRSHKMLVLCLTFSAGCATSRPQLFEVHTPSESHIRSQRSAQNQADLHETTPVVTPAVDEISGLGKDNESLLPESNIILTDYTPPPSWKTSVEHRYRLQDLEQLALQNNPTLKQAEASIVKAQGLRTQVGRAANPAVGYFASQLADRGTDQQGVFIEQQIVRGGKLSLNEEVMTQTMEVQRKELSAQQLRVLTDVRVLYHEAVAAQETLATVDNFVTLTTKATEISDLRVQAMEDSRIDLLQTKLQRNEVELQKRQASVKLAAVWEELTALIGTEALMPGQLVPEETVKAVEHDWHDMYATILANSPELAASQRKVSQTRVMLNRQEAQAIPNITAQLGAGFDRATDSGMINLQFSGTLPVYNRNQGNVSAAYADFCRATHEVDRVRNELKARLARVARQYDSALVAVKKYEEAILPQAQEGLELATSAYSIGEINFLQLLILQQSYFEAKLSSITARKELLQAQVMLDGLLLSGGLSAPEGVNDGDELRGQALDGQ